MKLLFFVGASTGTFYAFKGITGDSGLAMGSTWFFVILYALMAMGNGKK